MDFQVMMKEIEELLAQGEPLRAEAYLRQCMEEAFETGQYGMYVAVGNQLIGFFRGSQQYEKAFRMSEDLLLLMEELQQEETEHFAEILLNTAAAYRASGNDRQAYDNYVRALKIYEMNLDAKDKRFIPLFQNLAMLLGERGEYEGSMLLREKAAALIGEGSCTEAEGAEVLTGLALDYLLMGREIDAEQALLEALKIFENEKEDADLYYSLALAGIGEVYAKIEKYEDSLKAYERALNEIEKSLGRQESYNLIGGNCALIAELLGDQEKAAFYRENMGNTE